MKLDRNEFGSGLSDICTARGLWVFPWLDPFLRFLVWAEQPLKLLAEAAQQEETFRTQNLGELNPFCQGKPHQTHPKWHFHQPSVPQHRMSLPPAQGALSWCQSPSLCPQCLCPGLPKGTRVSSSSFPKGFSMLTTSETGQELSRFILAGLSVRSKKFQFPSCPCSPTELNRFVKGKKN